MRHPLPLLAAIGAIMLAAVRPAAAEPTTAAESVSAAESTTAVGATTAAEQPLEAAVSMTLAPGLDRLTGQFTFEVRNETEGPLEAIPLLLYPRALARPAAALNDINYRWVYPGKFEGADLEVSSLSIAWPGEAPHPVRPVDLEPAPPAGGSGTGSLEPDLASAPLVQLPLPRPLQPGEVLELRGAFETRIPRRFGGFGRLRDQLALQGGFFPLIPGQSVDGFDLEKPLPVYEYRLSLEMPAGLEAWLAGRPYTGPLTVRGAAPSLRVGSRLSVQTLHPPGAPPIELIWMPDTGLPPARHAEWARLERVVMRAMADLEAAFPGLVRPGDPLRLIQAPLRDVFTLPVEDGIWVSDRLYRVMSTFRRFHDLELRWRLYQQILERVLEAREGPDLAWVAEGMAFQLAQRLKPAGARDADLEGMLGKFTAIPLIDRLLYNPTYAQGETYARSPYRPDRFRQHLETYAGPGAEGPVIFNRLEARLGADRLHDAITRYLEAGPAGPDWLTLLARETGQPSPVPEAWRRREAGGNYRLLRPEITRTPDGFCVIRVDVVREGEAPPEPVTVEVTTRPVLNLSGVKEREPLLQKERARAVWDGSGEKGTLEFKTRTPPHRVTIDPERELQERTRADNEHPVRYNWIIWDLLVWASAGRAASTTEEAGTSGGEVEAFASLLLNLRYKDTHQERHVWDFKAYRLEESLGGSMGYYHYFGRNRTVYRWEHELKFDLGYRQLRSAFELGSVRPAALADDSPRGALTLRAGYSFENRLNPFAPIRGQALDLYAQVGAGIDESGFLDAFGAIGLHARRLFPFDEVHGLAARLKLETFLMGDRIPLMNLFLLGGYGEMRSVAARAEGGESKVLFSVEERHPIWLEADIDLLIFRLREIRGVAFLDVGAVGERGFRGIGPEEVRVGVGYGMRWVVDLFGLSPLLFAVDVAMPVDGWIRDGVLPDLGDAQLHVGSYHAF